MSEASPSRSTARLEAWCVAAALVFLAAWMVWMGLRSWLPALASRHGAGMDRMLVYLLAATGVLLLVGHLALGWLIVRAAGSPRVTLRMASPRSERAWSIVPGLVMTIVAEGGVLAIGLPAWSEYFGTAPPAQALTIEVTAEQFAWNVRYAGPDGAFGRTDLSLLDATNPLGRDLEDPAGQDDIFRVNRLHAPVNRPIRVRLRAKDVIHSFFLPEFRVKQDAVPGMTIDVWFVPTRVGEYELACTELCGLAHYYMKGIFQVMEPEEFERWVEESAAEDA